MELLGKDRKDIGNILRRQNPSKRFSEKSTKGPPILFRPDTPPESMPPPESGSFGASRLLGRLPTDGRLALFGRFPTGSILGIFYQTATSYLRRRRTASTKLRLFRVGPPEGALRVGRLIAGLRFAFEGDGRKEIFLSPE